MYSISDQCGDAIADYRWLLDRRYSEHVSRALVADRHRLTRDERAILFRGVSSSADSSRRSARLVDLTTNGADSTITIDAANVLYTVCAYLLGRPVFISTDGLLRDAAEIHGGDIPHDTLTQAAATVVPTAHVVVGVGGEAHWVIDSTLGSSDEIHDALIELGVAESSAGALRSADAALISEDDGWIASSDSRIIDRGVTPVIDLPRRSITAFYACRFEDLRRFV